MNLDITEEERDFLERVCTRAEIFCRINITSPNKAYSDFEKDMKSIQRLIIKLKALDSNLMNKAMYK
jgi:hypothetical protein